MNKVSSLLLHSISRNKKKSISFLNQKLIRKHRFSNETYKIRWEENDSRDKSILICFYAIRVSTICISEWTSRIFLSRYWHNILPSLSSAVNGAECHGAIPCYLAPCRTRHFRGNLVAMSLRCLANASYIRTKTVLLMRFHIVTRSAITELPFDFRSVHDICQSTNI